MPDEVILDVTTIEENVTVETTAGDVVEIQVVAPTGTAATVAVGTTTTGSAGTNASVTNSGTTSAAVFNFTIPRGDTGETGATGATGAAGPNSVTSATTSDGTADLDVDSITGDGSGLTGLVSSQITDASTVPVYNESTELFEEVAVLYNEDGVINASDFQTEGSYFSSNASGTASFSATGSPINVSINDRIWRINNPTTAGTYQYTQPNANGTYALTASTTGVPDKLTDGTIAGTLAINSTSYTYGTGAAAAHRTALGVSASGDTVLKSAYTPAHSLLVQQSGTGSPSSLSVGNNTILGRASGGGSNIAALSGSDARTVLGLTTLATTTPAANVATFLESPTSANLAAAVTDETGSGSLVFATSPSLTSPTIDTSATFNATTYTYGAGAALAHRNALGVGTRISALASNTSVTNTTTLQTVASLSVVAGKSYAVYAQISIEGTVLTGTRHGITFPASTLIRMTRKRSTSYIPVEVSSNLNLGLAETATLAELVGFITVAVTGTVELQFAQNTSNANTTTCRTFTYLTLTELV
jgi:hypothetical protein